MHVLRNLNDSTAAYVEVLIPVQCLTVATKRIKLNR